MRVRKTLASGESERYYYDGQMPMETSSSSGVLTRNFLGARGLEAVVTTSGSSTSVAYPMYDCHGNMVATLAKSGSGYSVGNLREYDVWGSVRSGAQTGAPAGRYCANLGHVSDDDSGLVYMRARYYESESGRFVSEDPARDGGNWYVYCSSSPVCHVDESGQDFMPDSTLTAMLVKLHENLEVGGLKAKIIASAALLFIWTWFLAKEWIGLDGPMRPPIFSGDRLRKYNWLKRFGEVTRASTSPGHGSVMAQAEAVTSTYSMMLTLSFWILAEDIDPN